MKSSPIIEQLRQFLPPLAGSSWGNRIAGAADLEAVQDKARLVRPALYVVMAEDVARASPGAFWQEITERFSVIAVLDQKDRRGQLAQDMIQDLRTGIFQAILNWKPDTAWGPVTYAGGQMLAQDAALYFHRFDFTRRLELDEDDGFLVEHDNFDRLFAKWIPEGATDQSPLNEQSITGIFTL